jgi:hypothetical protein
MIEADMEGMGIGSRPSQSPCYRVMVRHVGRPHHNPQCPGTYREGQKGFVGQQFAIEIKPHPWTRSHAQMPDTTVHDMLGVEVSTHEKARRHIS